LATDYDGTLAESGHVAEETLVALRQLRESGRKLVLVTGRQYAELLTVFSEVDLFDAIVAENGGVIWWPAEQREDILGEPFPPLLLEELVARGVAPYSVGRVIFAGWRPQESIMLEAIQRHGTGHQIIFNKQAVMLLPSGINKATGLTKVLNRWKISPQQVVGIGDAENDHAFLEICGVAAAVSNAVPALQERCDLVTTGARGAGVRELIARLLADDLQSLGARRSLRSLVERSVIHESATRSES
jgi:hypothetical protein